MWALNSRVFSSHSSLLSPSSLKHSTARWACFCGSLCSDSGYVKWYFFSLMLLVLVHTIVSLPRSLMRALVIGTACYEPKTLIDFSFHKRSCCMQHSENLFLLWWYCPTLAPQIAALSSFFSFLVSLSPNAVTWSHYRELTWSHCGCPSKWAWKLWPHSRTY